MTINKTINIPAYVSNLNIICNIDVTETYNKIKLMLK